VLIFAREGHKGRRGHRKGKFEGAGHSGSRIGFRGDGRGASEARDNTAMPDTDEISGRVPAVETDRRSPRGLLVQRLAGDTRPSKAAYLGHEGF
jgi:hypothetical protein